MTAEAWPLVEQLYSLPAIQLRYGESVTIAEHMLQAAALAETEGAPDELVVAGLVHDVGHLAEGVDPDTRNRSHARLGHETLTRVLPAGVTEPVRLHIAAKRYLVATDPDYFDRLSPASVHTLELQGGPIDPDGQRAFLAEPYHEDALRLREWDESAKVAGLAVPSLRHYQSVIEALAAC